VSLIYNRIDKGLILLTSVQPLAYPGLPTGRGLPCQVSAVPEPALVWATIPQVAMANDMGPPQCGSVSSRLLPYEALPSDEMPAIVTSQLYP
jgi:hypothetical protein